MCSATTAAVSTRLIAYGNAACPRRLNVVRVDSNGTRGDEAQVRQGLERRRKPLDSPPRIQDDVGALHAFQLLCHVPRPVEVQVNVAVGIKTLKVWRSLNLGWEVSGNDELSAASPSW